KNAGNGIFSPGTPYATGSYPAEVAAHDYDGDGVLDLAVANAASDSVSILIGRGDGTFKAQVQYDAGSQPSAVAAGDFNGDGKLDLAVSDEIKPGKVSILLNQGGGTFGAPASYPTDGAYPHSATVGDFNGDGRLDLAVVNGGSGTVAILRGS